MKKIFIIIMITLMGIFGLTSTAITADIGRFCWNLQPFPDNIELAVVNQAAHYGVYGVLRNPQPVPGFLPNVPGPYSFAIDGAATPDPIHGDIDLELCWSDLIDTQSTGIIHAKLLPGLVGPWQVFEILSGLMNGGNLVPVPCPIP